MLVAMGIVLLVAIVAGQQLGNRTIFGQTEHKLVIPGQAITPVPEESAPANEATLKNWKRLQVVSVATDPAFPDPRVTPPPPPPPPRPSASPKPTPSPTLPAPDLYTSPPLPVPIVSHDPAETPAP